jgi:hypothetical protein
VAGATSRNYFPSVVVLSANFDFFLRWLTNFLHCGEKSGASLFPFLMRLAFLLQISRKIGDISFLHDIKMIISHTSSQVCLLLVPDPYANERRRESTVYPETQPGILICREQGVQDLEL